MLSENFENWREYLIVTFQAMSITISNVVSEKNRNVTSDDCHYLSQIASEIQTKAYHQNVIFTVNKCAN